MELLIIHTQVPMHATLQLMAHTVVLMQPRRTIHIQVHMQGAVLFPHHMVEVRQHRHITHTQAKVLLQYNIQILMVSGDQVLYLTVVANGHTPNTVLLHRVPHLVEALLQAEFLQERVELIIVVVLPKPPMEICMHRPMVMCTKIQETAGNNIPAMVGMMPQNNRDLTLNLWTRKRKTGNAAIHKHNSLVTEPVVDGEVAVDSVAVEAGLAAEEADSAAAEEEDLEDLEVGEDKIKY